MKTTSIVPSREKIGTLTQAGSDINLGPSVLTLGGLQYHTEATLVAALPTLAANNRYQIFAVLNAGNVELRISQNENSQGPTGFSTYKLVGSFYANGLTVPSFGSFIRDLKGCPKTDTFFLGTTGIKTGGVLILSKGSVAVDECYGYRDGDRMFVQFVFRQSVQSGSLAVNGNWGVNAPAIEGSGMADSKIANLVGSENTTVIGSGHIGHATTAVDCNLIYDSNNGVNFYKADGTNLAVVSNAGGGQTNVPINSVGIVYMGGSFDYPVQSLNNTPIEDL